MQCLPLITAVLALSLAGCGEFKEIPGPVTPGRGTDGTMFVANKRGASLSRVDLATGEETHRVETCENPHELTVSPDESMVLVACYSGRTLEVYRAADLERASIVYLGDDARVHSALWFDQDRAIAGAEGRGSLYLIDDPWAANPVQLEIGGGGPGPHLVAIDSAGENAWGTVIPTGEVVRYDLEELTEAARRRVGNQIEAIALSPDGVSLWVSSNADNVAYRLDSVTLETQAEVATGSVPIRLAMHPSGRWVVSSNYGTGDLTVIDTATNTVARTIAVSGSDEAAQVTLVFSADGTRLYAAETAANTVAEIDFESGEVLRRLPTGPGGDGLAVVD